VRTTNLRPHYSKNKADYHHTLIFSKSEQVDLIDSFNLSDKLSSDLRGEYFEEIYAPYKAKAKVFWQRVRSTFDESTYDEPRALNQKYRRFLNDISSQPSSHESQPDINVLIINPLSINRKQTTRIHCKEGNKITHQFLNFYDDNLISRITREVVMYLTFLKLVLRSYPTSTHIASDVASDDLNKTLPLRAPEEISNLLKKISGYSKTTQSQQSLHRQDTSSQTSSTSKKNALELYYDLKTCYEKNKHLIKQLTTENLSTNLSQDGEYSKVKEYAEDLASQRFVEAIKTEEKDDFKEYAGSKFLGCGIRCSYDQKDPKELSIERYDYQNAEPETSKTMYLKIKKFDESGKLKGGRNYRTLQYSNQDQAEEKQYCFIKITFDENGEVSVDNENIYTSNSLNPDQKQSVSLSSLTRAVEDELIQDISWLTLDAKNYRFDKDMQLEKKEKKLKLSEFFTKHIEKRDEDRDSIYESDSNSDRETVVTDSVDIEQDLRGFDSSLNLSEAGNRRSPSSDRALVPEARLSWAPSPEARRSRALVLEKRRSRAPSPEARPSRALVPEAGRCRSPSPEAVRTP
jgi:hypothetical protein